MVDKKKKTDCLRLWLHCCAFLSAFIATQAHSSGPDVQEVISEAYSLLSVKPEEALKNIGSVKSALEVAEPETQLEAYMVALWAGIYLTDSSTLSEYSDKVLGISDPQLLQDNLNRLLIVSAGHLWRSNDNVTANKLVVCSLDHVRTTPRFLSTLLMLGVTSPEESAEVTEFINKYGAKLAEKAELKRYQAAFTNNLGVSALKLKQYKESAELFSQSLDLRYEIAHQSGQVNSANNLLLSYYLLKDWNKFERLAIRAKRMLDNYVSPLNHAYFNFVYQLFALRNTKNLSVKDVSALQGHLDEINEWGLQRILVDVSQEAGITLLLPPPSGAENHDEILQHLDVCEWQDIKPLTVGQMFRRFNSIEATLKDTQTPNP